MNSTETETANVIELRWEGPFRWPGLRCEGDATRLDGLNAAAVAATCGVYLWTVEHSEGFLIYAAGVTCRPFSKRFMEHTRNYRTGIYTIFDVASMKEGIRNKVWPGFWFKKRSPEMLQEYERRAAEIGVATNKLLSNYRIFVASAAPIRRLLQRIEASIMNNLYAAPGAACVIPDRGMALAPRWENERPVLVRSTAPVMLHGLPREFEA